MKKFIALLILAAAVFMPVTAQASQQTRTLQPGRVYEFTGTDARVISHVNVSGTTRYQIVARDADGEITRFGFAAGRFSISGTGTAQITPNAPLTVTFDPARIRVTEREGNALRRIEVWHDETLRVENRHTAAVQIRTGGAAKFVISNRHGDVTDFGINAHMPLITVPANGYVLLETACDSSLTVYFPDAMYREEIRASRSAAPALRIIWLTANRAETITVAADGNFAPQFSPETENEIFSYEYILRGRDGHVLRHGETSENELRLSARQSATITPLAGGRLYFPYAWRGDLLIENGAAAPAYFTLRAGFSLEVANADATRAHMIFVRGADGGDFSFEYVQIYDGEVFVTVADDVTENSAVNLPAGATVKISATAADLTLNVPDVPAISAEFAETAALIRHEISAGASVFFENGGLTPAKILFQSGEESSADYVIFDGDDEVISFGRVADGAYIVLEETHSAILTSPDYAGILLFPRVLEELAFSAHNAPALYRRVLEYGDVLRIDNNDRRQYSRAFLVENETGRAAEFAYDFVLTNAGNAVFDFGFGAFGLYTLPPNRRVTLAPQDGVELSVAFPARWRTSLRVTRMTEQPLYRITLTPGRSVTLNNHGETDFRLANNSRAGRAGFHLYGQGEWVEFYYFPYRVFIPSRPVNLNTDTPLFGDIHLPAGTRFTIFAALGEDLEIWLPRLWARQMGLGR